MKNDNTKSEINADKVHTVKAEDIRDAEDGDISASARRLMAIRGDDAFTEDNVENSTPAEKVGFWENYWYHHKWKTIIVGFFTLVIILTLTQVLTKAEPDINILYAGPAYIPTTEYNEICNIFSEIMPEDFNDDGEKTVAFKNLTIKSDEQIEADKVMAEAEGRTFTFDYQANNKSKSVFSTEIFVGEYVVLLLDNSLYNEVLLNGGLCPLSDVTEGDFSGATDEYSARLGDMKLYKYYKAMQVMPADTVLCVRRVSTMTFFKNSKKQDKVYSAHLDFIRAAAGFEYPIGYTAE